MLDDAAVDDILQSLRETIACCEPRVDATDPQNCLRSEALTPPPRVREHQSLANAPGVVESVRQRRAQSLTTLPSVGDLRGGKLLVLDVDWQLSEGACEAATDGYMDYTDTPPWDTWVAFVIEPEREIENGNYLVSWVPPAFLHLIPLAIDVSSTDCVYWLEQSHTLLKPALTRRGIAL